MSSHIKSLALIVGLPAAAVVISGYQSYQIQLQSWLTTNVAESVIEEIPFDYQVKVAPNFSDLKSTFVELKPELEEVETIQDIEEQQLSQVVEQLPEEDVVIQPITKLESTDFMSQLDLSELAPELALKVESALKSERVEPQAAQDASNLSLQPELWYDRLPAMNFQTHVYSSQMNKRWVKVNGVEYSEGNWIGDEVELVSIEPQSCLIRFQGELIEVPALYDWQG